MSTKRDLEIQMMQKIKQMLGYEPIGMLDLLHILSHPEMIEMTKTYLSVVESED